jgi:phosphate transport system substrate-binding protein
MASERRIVRVLNALVALSLFSSAAFEAHAQKSGAKPAPAKLTVSGSSLLAPLMNDVSRRFEAQHQGIAIDIRRVGSARAVAEVRTGACDIAMLSRGALDSERNLFLFPIARDGVAVIVHRTNPLKNVTDRQLTDILTGKLTNWKSLGGRDAPVHLGWRTSGQGSVELILDHLDLKREQIGRHTTVIANADSIHFAANDPNAITLASVGESERSAEAGIAIKLLAFNGVPASNRTLQNRSYELSRPVTLVTRQLPSGLQKKFIEYALSAQVVDLQRKYGFVPYQE